MPALKPGTITIDATVNGYTISFNNRFGVLNDSGQVFSPQFSYQNGQEAQASAKIVEIASLTIA